MPKITNPIKIMKLKQGVLEGKTDRQALLDAGFAENTANHKVGNTKLLTVVHEEVRAELTDGEIIERLKRILKLKLSVEEKLFNFIDSHKEITPENLRTVTLAINKTKDNIAEITKTLRLVCGESTEKIDVTDERQKRLASMLGRVSIN